MCAKTSTNKKHTMFTIVSVLLCLVAVASTVAFVLSRVSLQKAHEAKWKDYDDCGIS